MMFVLMLLLLAACGTEDSKPESTSSSESNVQKETTKDPVTIKMVHFWPEHEAQMKKTVEMFENQNSGIKVELSAVTWDTIENTIKTKIAANDHPDIAFAWPGAFTQQFVAMDEVMELTDAVNSDAEWIVSILENPLRFGENEEGKIYNLPFRGTYFTMFYNKDLFDKFSISVPTNVSEFNEVLADLHQNGVLPIAASGSPAMPGYLSDYLDINGFLNANGDLDAFSRGEIPKNSQESEQAITQFKDWYDKGYLDKNLLTITAGQAHEQFFSGKAAILGANNNELQTIVEGVDFKMGVFPLPLDNGDGYSYGSMDGFIVMKKTKHPEEALKLAKFLTSDEVQTMWAQETGSVMVNPNAIKVYEDPLVKEMADNIKYVSPQFNSDLFAQYSEQTWQQEIVQKMQAVILGKLSPKKYVDWLEEQRTKYLITN